MRSRHPAPAGGADSGVTLIEVVVSMTIMAIVITVFTDGVLLMFQNANRSESVQIAQSQLTVAYQRLDQELRYAASISEPGPDANNQDHYVEYLNNTGSTDRVCTQLRLKAGNLQRRSWTQGSTAPAGGSWSVLASNVTSDTPFATVPSTTGVAFQQLEVRLSATSGANRTAVTTDARFLFTALNSMVNTANAGTCREGRANP